MKDIFGEFLIACRNGDNTSYTVERDDGYCNESDPKVYFSEFKDWQPFEQKLMSGISGNVLDLGAGAGRHSLYLQEQGCNVHAVDISAGAVQTMLARGVKNVYCRDLRALDFQANYYDYILMMFNNFGLGGNVANTRKMLNALSRLGKKNSKLISTTVDPYRTKRPEHLIYHQRNRDLGFLGGLVALRIVYKDNVGDWFNLLMVSPEELSELTRETAWEIESLSEPNANGFYGLVLKNTGK